MRKDPPALVSAAWTSDIETLRLWAPPQFQIGVISSAREYLSIGGIYPITAKILLSIDLDRQDETRVAR